MPGFVLHLGATVTCSHSGRCTPTAPYPRVLVGNQPVTTVPSPWVVAGCALPPPPGANGPCVTAQWTSGATRVLAGGQPVLVQSNQAVCTPTGQPVIIVSTQTRVSAT